MRKIYLIALLLLSLPLAAKNFILKTNLPYVATATPNLGVEFAISPSFSLNIEGGYTPFKWNKDRYLKHFVINPEVRYWLCHRFVGSFVGVHGFYGEYNFDYDKWFNHRYDGRVVGAGFTYGYHFYLSKHWGIELLAGVGYAYLYYDKYKSGHCGDYVGKFKRNYIGPTRLAVSILHIF